MELGASSFYFLLSLTLTLFVLFLLDQVTPGLQSIPAITDDDHKIIKRVTDIVTDDTIIDLVDETEGADNFLKDALRLQIVQGCQFLRSYLTSVNLLMKKYNAIKPSIAPSSKV